MLLVPPHPLEEQAPAAWGVPGGNRRGGLDQNPHSAPFHRVRKGFSKDCIIPSLSEILDDYSLPKKGEVGFLDSINVCFLFTNFLPSEIGTPNIARLQDWAVTFASCSILSWTNLRHVLRGWKKRQ